MSRDERSLCSFYFIFYLVVGISSPYLQILLAGLGYDKATIGFLQALFDLVGLVGPLLVGPLADRTKKHRTIIVVLLLLIPLALVPLVSIRLLPVAAACLAVYSVGVRSVSPVSDALVHDVLPDAEARYGRVRAYGSAGFIAIGLVIQCFGLIDASSPLSIALWTGGTVFLSLLAVSFLPSSRERWKRERMAALSPAALPGAASPAAGARAPLPGGRDFAPGFWIGLSVIALGRLASVPFNNFLSLYIEEAVKVNWVSGMWALGAIAEIPLMVLAGRALKRFGMGAVMSVCMAAMALRLALNGLFPAPWALVLGQLLHSLSFGLFYPATVAFIAQNVSPRRLGLGMALNLSVASALPSLVGNLAGGWMIQATGGYRLLFLSGSGLALLALALSPFAFRKRRAPGRAA